MMRFISKSTKWFYSTELHGKNIPKDAVEISENERKLFLEAMAIGNNISFDEYNKPFVEN